MDDKAIICRMEYLEKELDECDDEILAGMLEQELNQLVLNISHKY